MATTIIALYAAVVATISAIASAILGYLELKRHRPRVRVTAHYGVISEQARGNSEPLIFLEAVNEGSGALSITGIGWLLRDGRKIQYATPPLLSLPVLLSERRKCTTYIPCRTFNEDSDRALYKHPFFQDETGSIWKGRITRDERKLWMAAPSSGWKVW